MTGLLLLTVWTGADSAMRVAIFAPPDWPLRFAVYLGGAVIATAVVLRHLLAR